MKKKNVSLNGDYRGWGFSGWEKLKGLFVSGITFIPPRYDEEGNIDIKATIEHTL